MDVLESGGLELEERSVICGNALEESRGIEVELATDHIISRTMQMLLDGCDADHLCGFLRSCSKDFVSIAMDRSGSHVAETALNSLANHLQDEDFYNLIKDTLSLICQVVFRCLFLYLLPSFCFMSTLFQIGSLTLVSLCFCLLTGIILSFFSCQAVARELVSVMCNCHGSHVIRSLLCLCKGVPLNSEFHAAKSSTVLSQRLNLKAGKDHESEAPIIHQGFPDLLVFLVTEMLKCSERDTAALQVDQYSSLVLQACSKSLLVKLSELLVILIFLLSSYSHHPSVLFFWILELV